MTIEVSPRAIHYTPPGPIAKAFIKSDAFVCGILGPIGSGKSTACWAKLVRNMQKQQRGSDGWIRRRTAIIRNTYPELKTTTIKTWHQWIPPSIGNYRDSGPPTHHIVNNGEKVDWEVIFIALDRPDDVRKLLSMELSDAWINEAKEVPKQILDGLTGRVGRFPRTERDPQGNVTFTCTDAQIMMDTNPPDTDHWWYRLAEDPKPEDEEQLRELEAQLAAQGALKAGQRLFEWYRQPGGEEPGAENLNNLPPGYYLKAKANKSGEWVKVYVHANYGYVLDGRPVYPDYNDSTHCKVFELNPRIGLHIGMDFGLTPAAIFAQQMPNGQWRKRSEIVTERFGIKPFAGLIKRHLAQQYPNYKLITITGDPAGNSGQPGHEEAFTCFQILSAEGIEARPAKTNLPSLRIEAVANSMRTMIDGEPGMVIHPDCRTLRKGYQGAYNYKRVQISGQERFRDEPDKNNFSHIADADQYLMIGAGEGKAMMRAEPRYDRPRYAVTDITFDF